MLTKVLTLGPVPHHYMLPSPSTWFTGGTRKSRPRHISFFATLSRLSARVPSLRDFVFIDVNPVGESPLRCRDEVHQLDLINPDGREREIAREKRKNKERGREKKFDDQRGRKKKERRGGEGQRRAKNKQGKEGGGSKREWRKRGRTIEGGGERRRRNDQHVSHLIQPLVALTSRTSSGGSCEPRRPSSGLSLTRIP